MLDYMLINLLSALVYNGLFIILALIGIARAAKNKSFGGWFLAGCLLQCVALFGNWKMLEAEPSAIGWEHFYYDLGVFLFFLALLFFFAYAAKMKAGDKASVAKKVIETGSAGQETKAVAEQANDSSTRVSLCTEEKQPAHVPVDTQTSHVPDEVLPRFCRQCGTPVVEGAAFCRNCGSPVLTENQKTVVTDVTTPVPETTKGDETAAAIRQKICNNCGAPVVEGTSFCWKCGSPVVSDPEPGEVEAPVKKENDEVSAELDLSSLPPALRRAYIFIEDEEWDRAEKYLEQVLDKEPENAFAYLGKAMTAVHVATPTQPTAEEMRELINRKDYKRAKQFADSALALCLNQWEKAAYSNDGSQ